jgi:hypothetical protein
MSKIPESYRAMDRIWLIQKHPSDDRYRVWTYEDDIDGPANAVLLNGATSTSLEQAGEDVLHNMYGATKRQELRLEDELKLVRRLSGEIRTAIDNPRIIGRFMRSLEATAELEKEPRFDEVEWSLPRQTVQALAQAEAQNILCALPPTALVFRQHSGALLNDMVHAWNATFYNGRLWDKQQVDAASQAIGLPQGRWRCWIKNWSNPDIAEQLRTFKFKGKLYWCARASKHAIPEGYVEQFERPTRPRTKDRYLNGMGLVRDAAQHQLDLIARNKMPELHFKLAPKFNQRLAAKIDICMQKTSGAIPAKVICERVGARSPTNKRRVYNILARLAGEGYIQLGKDGFYTLASRA